MMRRQVLVLLGMAASVTLAAIAWKYGHAANAGVGIADLPPEVNRAVSLGGAPPVRSFDVEDIVVRNVFSPDRRFDWEVANPILAVTDSVKQASPPLRLHGIALGAPPLAIVATGDGRTGVLRAGDSLAGWRLDVIHSSRVIVVSEGVVDTLELRRP